MTGEPARVLRPGVGDAIPACAWLGIGLVCLFAAASLDQEGWQITALWSLGPLLAGLGGFWLWLTATTRLSLDDAGFTYQRGGRSHRYDWRDLQAVTWIAGGPQRFSHVEVTFRTPQRGFSFLSPRPVTYAQLEDGFGLGGRRLADLMSDYCRLAWKDGEGANE